MKKTLFFSVLALLALAPAFAGTITVTQPAGGDVVLGAACPISWTATGITSNVRINLITPGGALVGLIIGNQAADSSPYTWTAGAPAVAGERYRVRVAASDGSGMGESAIFTVVAGGGDPGDPEDPEEPTPPGAGITVTQPSAGSSWRPGTRQTLTWTKSGRMPVMVQISLRREGAPETEEPVLRIADGCANNGSRVWFIPDDLAPGRYFVRVRASGSIRGDSPVFAIDAAGTRGEVAGPDTPIRAELEIPGVGVEYYNRHIVAWVKNNGPESLRAHDVKFRLSFPESGGSEQIITARISVPVGAEESVQLLSLEPDHFPGAGLRTAVRIDTSLSHIQDTNPYNQHRDVRIFADSRPALDLEIQLDRDRTTITHVLVSTGRPFVHKYHIRGWMRLRNRSAAPAEIARVKCRWVSQSRNTGESAWQEGYPASNGSLQLGPFRSGEFTACVFEFDFLVHDYDAVVYHRVLFDLDPERLLNDPDRSNNTVASGEWDHR